MEEEISAVPKNHFSCVRYLTCILHFTKAICYYSPLEWKSKAQKHHRKKGPELRSFWGNYVGFDELTFVLDCTWSLHIRHFLTLGEQREQVAIWPHGPNRVSLFISEQTMHSSSDSCSMVGMMRRLEFIWQLLSEWHLAKTLQRLGSGQRSIGDWPFLFLALRSAPFAARKHAMEALLFLSPDWLPRPISSLPTSCMSCSCRSWDKVWCLSASCSGVSLSLSGISNLAPALTNNLTIWVCCLSTARCKAVCWFTFWMSRLAWPCNSKAISTSVHVLSFW